jgi:lysophospholipase L1-like esterase
MSRTHAAVRGALLLGATAAGLILVGCRGDASVFTQSPVNNLFTNYVALGNSITAGWQSGGINDSTQRQSYAFLLAQQMQTRFAYPSFPKPGCPVPTGSFISGKTIDSLAPVPGGCTFRAASGITDVLNNVAVPYSYALDLQATKGTIIPNALPQFILGGMSQVERALAADPTFLTLWVGNNETLIPASLGQLQPTGYPPLIPPATFIAAYGAAVNRLMSAPHLRGGVLISATKITSAPRFFSADSLANPARKADFDFITGKTNTIVGCGASGALVSQEVIAQIRSSVFPPVISCIKNVPQAPLGDLFILDPTEIATFNATTDAYNAYIRAKADSIGFAYVDVNPALASLRQQATTALVATFPNFRSSTVPYGSYFSLDGAHPSNKGQAAIANLVISSINAKYGTNLAAVAIP